MYAASSALALVVLLVTFETGMCTNCYQCVSANSNDCKDPFNKAGKNVMNVNCDGQEVSSFYATTISYLGIPAPTTANARRYCVKMVLETTVGDSYIRTCVEGPAGNINKTCAELDKGSHIIGQGLQAISGKNVFKYCNVCNSDNCNGAAGTAASLTLAAGAAALAYLGYH